MTKKRVLIVEDDRLSLELINTMLKRLEVETVSATSGAEAIEQLGAGRFDLVILDLKLPDMDGLAVAETIRSQADPQHDLAIVVSSGSEVQETTERCRGIGCNAFLAKPFTFQQFVEVVGPILNRDQSEN